MTELSAEQQRKQEAYRDARVTGDYDAIWQSVGKCVFCDLNEKYVFHEENGVVMTVALFAYTDGHFMIVPRRHVRSVKEITPLEWETMRKMFYIAKKLIRKIYGIRGMQIVQKDGAEAQSTVEHIHFHCIPFDNPNLSTWNYQQLQNTPLQNANLYKSRLNTIEKLSERFAEKYQDE
jgi:histidine triad (HIT) family protein